MSFPFLNSIYPNVTNSESTDLWASQFLLFLVYPIPKLGRGPSEIVIEFISSWNSYKTERFQ